MDARQHSASVDQLVKNCDKLIDGGYHCAVVYSTPSGILMTTGTPVITDNIIKSLSQNIMGDSRWIQSADDMEKWSTNTKVCLPLLEKPIEKMSLIDLRTTIPQLLRAERGRKQVGWEKKCIPVWWPLDALPFKNVNQKPQDFEGNWMNALRLVISSCLSHHGFTPGTHYIGAPFIPTRRLSESASSESTSIQTSPECSLNKSSSFKESDSSSDFKAKENDSELSLGSPIFSSSPEINTPGSPNHKEDSSTTDSSSSKKTSLISPESPSPSLLLRKRVAHTPVGR